MVNSLSLFVDWNRLGDEVKTQMFIQNISYEKAAEKTGYTKDSIYRFLSKKTPYSRFVAQKLCELLNIDIHDFLIERG